MITIFFGFLPGVVQQYDLPTGATLEEAIQLIRPDVPPASVRVLVNGTSVEDLTSLVEAGQTIRISRL